MRSRGTLLTGGIYFATHSPVWNGGRALFDPDLPGTAAARAWLVTPQQFADIAAQEMYREPGEDLDLDEVLRTGRAAMGPGRYETLLYVGDVDGYPQLTFTADHGHRDVDPVPPSAPYLAMLVGGLQEAHGWSPEATADYLASRPGIGTWNAEAILAACIDDRSAP
ncbi:histone deacetylase [Allosaccharopolyspora coralli]|uniref:histone deacetylase n=1 Tax=Allosaccharopolyspora coralli TaxID=2665642 RepID=UPI001C9E3CFA|nr:histone deacetylase [Allosaccharopolyspora coralli]